MLEGVKRVHFVGLGGIGMSALARMLIQKGFKVSGSDVALNENLKVMKEAGAEIFVGHAPANVGDSDTVVFSSAVGEDNPELAAARRNGVRVMHRSELLSDLTKGKAGIAVAGMHGKTTTTNLIYHVFKNAGLSPSLVLGGISRDLGASSVLGKDSYFIYEADESDGTLVNYFPTYAVITNVEEEHIGYYDGLQSIMKVFKKFLGNNPSKEKVYCSIDCENIARLIQNDVEGYKTYSVKKPAAIHAVNIRHHGTVSHYDVIYQDRLLGEAALNLPGLHNISNSLPVVALSADVGIPFELIKSGLASFKGTKRRMEFICRVNGITVLDDYAHHPTEIKATISAAKKNTTGRLIAVFQPHRFTRLKHLFEGFATAFLEADMIILTDIYGAGEDPAHNVTSKDLYKRMSDEGGAVEYIGDRRLVNHRLMDHLKADDTVIFMGAGDITKTARDFAELLKQGHEAEADNEGRETKDEGRNATDEIVHRPSEAVVHRPS